MESPSFRLRGCHPLRPCCPAGSAMNVFSSNSTGHPHAALQPRLKRFGLLRFRSPLLTESLLISFPRLLRWFTSSRLAPPHYFIHAPGAGISPCGLPHSVIHGSQDMCSSPWLFAAYHDLPRLQAPRHPPWTYFRLTILFLLPLLLFSKPRLLKLAGSVPRSIESSSLFNSSLTFSFPVFSNNTHFLIEKRKKEASLVSVTKVTNLYCTLNTLPFSKKGGDPAAPSGTTTLLRLHPPHQAYLRQRPPLLVSLPASGVPDSDGVTGGVYKARERIHRAVLMRDY